MDFTVQLQPYRQRIEQALQTHLPPADTPPARLHAAMRYSLEAGGKRLRPVLLMAAADLFGAPDAGARWKFHVHHELSRIRAREK